MPNVGLVAAVVHEVVKARRFDDWTELSETVKTRCATLRIPYDSGTITEAVRLVERTRPVFTRRVCHVEHMTERADRRFTKGEAANLLERITVAMLKRGRGRV